MKILVAAGYCLQVNSSANLCHISYINGLLNAGHTVDLLSVSNDNQNVDTSIQLPKVRKHYTYRASLYEQLGNKKRRTVQLAANSNTATNNAPSSPSRLSILLPKLKNFLRSLYGPHETDIIWYYNTVRSFRSAETYDYVISLAFPPVSHKVVDTLLSRGRLHAHKWIQIWEDPWYADVFENHNTSAVKNEERKLLSKSDLIYYVSPLTLMYQKQLFPEYDDRMKWMPLPSYYSSEPIPIEHNTLCLGYFGDYSENVRNLLPFYQVASENSLKVRICGNASKPFASTNTVQVYPRMPLCQLKKYEDETNVLVFLCNLAGGQIPGKLYQYSATNKYILFILDGTEEEQAELHRYFSQFDRYVFCKNHKDSIREAIAEIEHGNLPESYTTPLECFAPEIIVESILEGK